MPCMYLPLNHFADFLIYVPDREDVVRGEDVYIFPRGAIAHNTGRSESALEPYKNAWHLLKETSPALFERKAEPMRILGPTQAKERVSGFSFVLVKQTHSTSSGRWMQQGSLFEVAILPLARC